MAADIAAAAAMRATVVAAVAAIGAAGVAARGASAADDPVAGYDLDHRCGACLSVSLAGLAHGLHLQPRFGRCPHEQRLARGLRHSSSLGPTENSPPEQAHFSGLLDQVYHLSLETDDKLASTVRLISRVGVVTLCLASFIKITCTRAKYSATDSLTPISSVSNSRFALSYGTSSVSAAIFVSARHASERDPISIIIFMISSSFSRAVVYA